jgi:cephalosporin-C deacetylase
MDEVVLPSTVYAAFNHYRHPEKEIIEYPFNGHEGGELRQQYRQAEWLAARQHVGSPQAGSTVAP